jgi:hypothetical protein
MQKWELTMWMTDISQGEMYGGASNIWSHRDKKTGESCFDALIRLAGQGWELVSVTPISLINGVTAQVLFTFKRPEQD